MVKTILFIILYELPHHLDRAVTAQTRGFGVSYYGHREYAGLRIPVYVCIAWLFSWQIEISYAGPTSASECMGAKQSFRYHILNIGALFEVYCTR